MARRFHSLDGNEAAARMAHKTNEVIAIYPITPSSPMGEHSDEWSAKGQKNLWGAVPEVVEMQSEGGAAGAVHGALQGGALTTTFTASQGLLLMIPNMYKIAGELTPTVFHVAARALATHALSIFGDHTDVMSTRSTGWAMLAASSVQESHDFALIAQAATLRARVPFLHFFDGFRTSHELNKIELIEDDVVRAMIDEEAVRAHRLRGLSPEHPELRGTAQNPDVFFQAREAVNAYYPATIEIVKEEFERFERLTGRSYKPFDYVGAADAERVIVLMGSGCGAADEAVERLVSDGEKIGMLKVRLYRPFSAEDFIEALPATTRRIGALDRTKEPGCEGEPLYLDLVSALSRKWASNKNTDLPQVFGGRYGMGSKEFTPAMVKSVFDELASDSPRHGFTVGIIDDVTHTSLDWDKHWCTEKSDVTRCMFYGLGADGTVGANKNSAKIIGENTELYAQGYFVYDSKKSGSVTVSHLRFGPRPIESTYLIDQANFIAVHQYNFVEKMDVLESAIEGGIFLLNSPYSKEEVWDRLPARIRARIQEQRLRFYVIDADTVAEKAGMGGRINTVMQACFFALSEILPRDEAVAQIKAAIDKTYGKSGRSIVEKNWAAVDAAVDNLYEIAVPEEETQVADAALALVGTDAPDFVQKVTAVMMAGKGDLLPVSAMPVDGTFPTDTAKYEKRSVAREIPIWDGDICIQCALCSFVCPHTAIRMKAFVPSASKNAPAEFDTQAWRGKELPGHQMRIQVAPDDCTGCGVCVDVCPAFSKENRAHKSINMVEKLDHLEREQKNFEHFLTIDELDRTEVKVDTVKGSQLLESLFEFSGACAGCGETPYIKLLTQLFGDRIVVANATGCSSIYGGNLPTTPYTKNAAGRGPAWSNSLFEDNAEFGMGMRLAMDHQLRYATQLLDEVGVDKAEIRAVLESDQNTEAGIREQRARLDAIREKLAGRDDDQTKALLQILDVLGRRGVWIIGGDGWAYDIGYGGLDHVLASGRNVNVLVLDTEVYSNTGGQASKATPMGAVAKFAASGKPSGKKDLGMIAMAYGNVYVAQVAIGANPKQTLKTLLEAESYDGPSLIIAYSTCIAHGIDMSTSMSHQKDAVNSGYWPLYRFDPRHGETDHHPFQLDSKKPKVAYREFASKEARFAMLERSNPEAYERLTKLAQAGIDERRHLYEQMTGVERAKPVVDDHDGVEETTETITTPAEEK